MFLLLGGARQRTIHEYQDLLTRSGWQFDGVRTAAGPTSLIQARRLASSATGQAKFGRKFDSAAGAGWR